MIDDSLQLSMQQFTLAVDAAPTGMILVDGQGRIAMVNRYAARLFGYAREELIGRPIEELVPGRFRAGHPGLRAAYQRQPGFRAMGAGRDLYGLRRDGSEVPVEIGLNPIHTASGDFVLSSVVDISERKRAEGEREQLLSQLRTLNVELEERVRVRTAELAATLREREVLLQEIHHRVKNNLQVISSLINMQTRQLPDEASRAALEECRGRVLAIALIHELLYQSIDFARVPFRNYVATLAHNVFHATGTSGSRVTLELAIDPVSLAVDQAIPCGLILNELITNALKHGFPAERRGRIRVGLRRGHDGRVALSVEDDGVGLPIGFDLACASTLGMQLVRTLAEQLEANVDIGRESGTTIVVRFPIDAP